MEESQKHHDKLENIQQFLSAGMNRVEVASKLGYSTWRSLDIFMRRSGMRWNGAFNKYVREDEHDTGSGTEEKDINTDSFTKGDNSTKTTKIVSHFKAANADPKQIAKLTGFTDHIQMAAYMSAKGYMWSGEQNNYIKCIDIKHNTESAQDTVLGKTTSETDRYSNLLDTLLKHEERLMELLIPEENCRTIPRYIIPGITRTKSFYMSDSLSSLLNEFCKCKNLSQKEVVEAALIEFFSRYSFKKEVDALVRSK